MPLPLLVLKMVGEKKFQQKWPGISNLLKLSPKQCIFEKMTAANYFVPVEAIKKSGLLAKCFQDTQFHHDEPNLKH